MLKSISLDKCKLTDTNVKELCFSLAVNRTLSLFSLADNSLTKAALKTLGLMLDGTPIYSISASALTRLVHFDQ
jgi:hypothetical protein